MLIVLGPSWAVAESPSCSHNQTQLKNSFMQFDDMSIYIKDSLSKYLLKIFTSDKSVCIIYNYKGDTIVHRLAFDPTAESRRFSASGVFFSALFSSANKNRFFFYVKGREIREIIPKLPNLYFRVKIDREDKRILFQFEEKNGTLIYAEYFPETGQFCPEEELLKEPNTP
jgi:hypothetical protein